MLGNVAKNATGTLVSPRRRITRIMTRVSGVPASKARQVYPFWGMRQSHVP